MRLLPVAALALLALLRAAPFCRGQIVSFRDESGANAVEAKYGATGEGTVVVILDRGIDWRHADFRNADGTTRIRWIYDMNPVHGQPVEYSAADINQALLGGTPLATLRYNLIAGGEGQYGRAGATSGSAPIAVGAIALLLEAAPQLTASQVRDLLRTTAATDEFTGPAPNASFGFGKLDVLAAMDKLCARGWGALGFCSSGLYADWDVDGDVDGRDFLIWQRGASTRPASADDLTAWIAQFGDHGSASYSTNLAPETAA